MMKNQDQATLAPHLERQLRAAGERLTSQRKLVVRILQERGGHLTAQEIHTLARRQKARLSLATVYRTLNWLKEAGVVRELRLNGGHCRYELNEDVRDTTHHHMVCLECGQVIEFTCDYCQEVHENLADQYGFEITGARVKLLGYCADCRARVQNQTKEKDSK